jgi:hypothetical protein
MFSKILINYINFNNILNLFVLFYINIMGCQCTKANEKSNMDLEHAPPKLFVETIPVRAIVQENEKVEEMAVIYIFIIIILFHNRARQTTRLTKAKINPQFKRKKLLRKRRSIQRRI